MTIGTGGVKLEDRVLDLGLNVLDTEATHIYVNSQQPTTYAEATTTYVRGFKNFGAGAGFGSPGAWTSGRKVSSVAITDGTITTTGTVACWSAVDAANSRLHAAGDLTGGGAVTAGQAFSLGSFDVQMAKAASAAAGTLDPAHSGPDVTLTNGYLTATMPLTSKAESARSITSHTSGKWYFEWYVNNSSSSQSGYGEIPGICNSGFDVTQYSSKDVNAAGIQDQNGTIWVNGVQVANILAPAATAGQYGGIAIDLTNNKMWIMGSNWTGWYDNPSAAAEWPDSNSGGYNITPIIGTSIFAIAGVYAGATITLNLTGSPAFQFNAATYGWTLFSAWG